MHEFWWESIKIYEVLLGIDAGGFKESKKVPNEIKTLIFWWKRNEQQKTQQKTTCGGLPIFSCMGAAYFPINLRLSRRLKENSARMLMWWCQLCGRILTFVYLTGMIGFSLILFRFRFPSKTLPFSISLQAEPSSEHCALNDVTHWSWFARPWVWIDVTNLVALWLGNLCLRLFGFSHEACLK